jgi:excisionase family DNA binding protein
MNAITQKTAEKLLLDCREAAERLSISARTLWMLTKAGQIAHVKAGRRVLYDPRDLTAWIDRNRVVAAAAMN